ncbi:MAG: hypothetical protein H6738_04350 [Alphaproteobacteria bacterium]|nr:hypothetical protein [Alphaproteobacteria bacterium]MCB9696003.1 hypothetical protein [Alphaproteobacteria bacterium]
MLWWLVGTAGAVPVVPITDVGGRYTNVIAQTTLAVDFLEVCFVGGLELEDVHAGGGSTAGGNCVPGDVGFLVESTARAAEVWPSARGACIAEGMRLPEVWEALYLANNAARFGFTYTGWAGNTLVQDPTIAITAGGMRPTTIQGTVSARTVAQADVYRCVR